MKKYLVYQHTNKINGKIYIGITCQKTKDRWKNGEGYKGCTYFYNAIQKYGWKNFKHKILKRDLPEECAKTYEKILIKLMDTQNPDIGYNIASGGDTRSDKWVPVQSLKDKIPSIKPIRILDWDDRVVRTVKTISDAAKYVNGTYSGVYSHLNKDIPYMNYFFETIQ